MDTLLQQEGAGTTSRRGFLGTAGALVVGFTLPVTGRAAAAAKSTPLSAWVRIGSDERVTVICGSTTSCEPSS